MEKNWTTDRIMHLIIGTALAGGLLWLVYYLRNALLPFFVAMLIAYLLQPLVNFNKRLFRISGRALPSVLAIIEVSAVIAGILLISLPSVTRELNELSRIVSDVADGKIEPAPSYAPLVHFINKYFNPDSIRDLFSGLRLEEIIRRGTMLVEQSIDVAMESLGWLLTLVYVLFILIDYDRIVRGFKMIVPARYRDRFLAVTNDAKVGMNHYFRGQGFVALCAMVLYCVGFLIVGLPLAVPMGILVGLLYMIPYFQYITVIPVAAICFVYSLGGDVAFWPELGKCAIVYLVSQCTCDYVITPHVMGRELGLNPAVILLSLSVWGTLLGIIGMIIALPVTALLMSYYARYISNR